jgi:hypothetical protein
MNPSWNCKCTEESEFGSRVMAAARSRPASFLVVAQRMGSSARRTPKRHLNEPFSGVDLETGTSRSPSRRG